MALYNTSSQSAGPVMAQFSGPMLSLNGVRRSSMELHSPRSPMEHRNSGSFTAGSFGPIPGTGFPSLMTQPFMGAPPASFPMLQHSPPLLMQEMQMQSIPVAWIETPVRDVVPVLLPRRSSETQRRSSETQRRSSSRERAAAPPRERSTPPQPPPPPEPV